MSDKQYTHHHDQTHLETALRRAKPWFDANATFLIYGLAAVLAVIAGVVWIQRQPDETSAVSALLLDAQTPEDFQNIADQYENAELGRLARLKQAEALLNSGTDKMFSDRGAAALELEQAEAALNRLTDAGSSDPLFGERVKIAKARLTELRCDGSEESVQAAVAAWQQVLDSSEATLAKPLAERRVAQLQKPESSSFYAWFHKLDPQPADDLLTPGLPGGGAGPGSAVPDVPPMLNLPSLSDPAAEDAPSSESTDETASEDTDESAETESATTESKDDVSADDSDADEESAATEEEAPAEEASPETAPESADSSSEEPAVEAPAEPEADAGE